MKSQKKAFELQSLRNVSSEDSAENEVVKALNVFKSLKIIENCSCLFFAAFHDTQPIA